VTLNKPPNSCEMLAKKHLKRIDTSQKQHGTGCVRSLSAGMTCDGMVAYEWQLDVGEALKLRLDCSVIAGTGAGKTIPFNILPLLVEKKTVVIIISPLR
jgi:hypothetical protein